MKDMDYEKWIGRAIKTVIIGALIIGGIAGALIYAITHK